MFLKQIYKPESFSNSSSALKNSGLPGLYSNSTIVFSSRSIFNCSCSFFSCCEMTMAATWSDWRFNKCFIDCNSPALPYHLIASIRSTGVPFPTGKPMDLSKPFYLIVTNKAFEIKNNEQKTIYTQQLAGLDVLVAFTYLHLIVQKLEDGLPKIEMSPFAKMHKDMASLSLAVPLQN